MISPEQRDQTSWIQIGVLTLVTVLCYLNTLQGTAVAWETGMYNHGYLIPAFAAYLLYSRRESFTEVSMNERWIGVAIITGAMLIRIMGAMRVEFTIDRLSMIICLLGVFVLVGGLRSLKWAGAPIAYLAFMFPLPGFMVDNILRPLQKIATITSTYALQTFGVEAFRDGNRIELEQSPLNVVDQCSGLRMATIFVALTVAVVMLINERPWWERIVILASALPIALAVNCIRITLTGLLYTLNVSEEIVKQIFHDFPGLIMMPIALGLLFLEMKILANLVIEDESGPQKTVGMGLGSQL